MSTMAIRQPSLPMNAIESTLVQNSPPVLSEAVVERATIDAVLKGNGDAFQALVEAHQTRVFNLAYRMLGNTREAEDAAQDAFTQAYARLRTYNPEWRFKTWIMTIVSNLAIDRLRRRKIEPLSFVDLAGPDRAAEQEPIENAFESHEPGPETVAIRRQRDAAVQSLLRELPDEDRAMVVMFYWEDLSYEEIAKATSASVSAVKSRLFRARQKMAQSRMAMAGDML
jgi:RNA polymerase sigma-70 factor (ECF subfamily)